MLALKRAAEACETVAVVHRVTKTAALQRLEKRSVGCRKTLCKTRVSAESMGDAHSVPWDGNIGC